jgi:hypothetical protein
MRELSTAALTLSPVSTEHLYREFALMVAPAAAAVANFCDHIEHNETADRSWIIDAGRCLRATSCKIAAQDGEDLRARYAARLRAIERRTPAWEPGAVDGGYLVERAATWRDLQLAQLEHDRRYHPDVIGLAKFDQLRHYALHIAKLAGALAEMSQGLADPEDFRTRRLPDLLLFGIKLATVTGQHLPEISLAEPVGERELVAA